MRILRGVKGLRLDSAAIGWGLLLGLFGCGSTSPALNPELEPGAPTASLHEPGSLAALGKPVIELVAIFIGQTACPGTNAPGLAPAIRSALDSLAADAAHHSVRFRSIGIALDPLPTTGIRLLKRFGEFNEIAVGGGWASIGALWSLWQTHPSRADIPQLVIIARELVDHPRKDDATCENCSDRWTVGHRPPRRKVRAFGGAAAGVQQHHVFPRPVSVQLPEELGMRTAAVGLQRHHLVRRHVRQRE